MVPRARCCQRERKLEAREKIPSARSSAAVVRPINWSGCAGELQEWPFVRPGGTAALQRVDLLGDGRAPALSRLPRATIFHRRRSRRSPPRLPDVVVVSATREGVFL